MLIHPVVASYYLHCLTLIVWNAVWNQLKFNQMFVKQTSYKCLQKKHVKCLQTPAKNLNVHNPKMPPWLITFD